MSSRRARITMSVYCSSLLMAACGDANLPSQGECASENCPTPQQLVVEEEEVSSLSRAAVLVPESMRPALPPWPIDPARELVITDPSVIRSPVETTFDPSRPSGTNRRGAWTFGRLVHNMLPKGQRNSASAASYMVMNWLRTWTVDQAPNPSVSPAFARPSIRLMIINPWKEASGCEEPESPATDYSCILDMSKAPFELLAIVNRPDLRIIGDEEDEGHDTSIAGEGRFVFQLRGPTLGIEEESQSIVVMDPTPVAQKFTLIFEFALPVDNASEIVDWAHAWHNLGRIPFGAQFRTKLLALTNAFAGPGVASGRANGNSLNQLRTNEVALMGTRFPDPGFIAARQVWELREFRLTTTGFAPHTVNLEPARDFDIPRVGQTGSEGTRTAELIDFLNENADAVVGNLHVIPAHMSGNSSLIGSAPFGAWGKLVNPNPPTIPSQGQPHDLGDVAIPVRDSFALNTCAGCHRHETDTRHFMHITLLEAMEPADRAADRANANVPPGTPEDTVILSNLLRREMSPGGDRFEDFAQLLAGPISELANKAGLHMCASSHLSFN